MTAVEPLLSRLPLYEDTIADAFSVERPRVPVYNERHVVEASLRRLLALEHASIR